MERRTSPLLRARSTWIAITGFWVLFGLTSWWIEYALSFRSPDGPMTVGRAAARLVYAVLWWGLSLCGIWICDAVPVRDFRHVHRIVFHILLGGAVSVLWAVLAYFINLAIIPGWLPLGVGRMISTTFIGSYFYYMALVVAANGVLHFRESHAREIDTVQTERLAERNERLAVEAQLQALKMELQPHFLFNALHGISALMHRDVKSANEMLVRLADMLEVALENVRDAEVTLAEEVETVKLYLSIHQVRLGERLQTEYDIDPGALSARVPHLILQPLVENAIKHGIADRATGGRIRISARVLDGRLYLAVQDDGVGLREARPAEGLGLKNTRERLAFLYGDRHTLSIAEAPGGGTQVPISIPLQKAEEIDATG